MEIYAEMRPELRPKVIEQKKNRRLHIGSNATLHFEERLGMQLFAVADEDLEQAHEEKTSSARFLRFELTTEMIARAK